MEEIIYPTNVENMDLVLAGPYSPNPAELLEDKLFENLITYWWTRRPWEI